MKNILKLPFLLFPLVLTSCFQPAKKENKENEVFDVEEPNQGEEVSEAEIVLFDGTKAVFNQNMDAEEKENIFVKLYGFRLLEENSDSIFEIKIESEDNKNYIVKSKARITSDNDKNGYYTRHETNNAVIQEASSSYKAFNNYSFGYTVKKDEVISLYGNIPSPNTVETINQEYGETVLTVDPDYEWGTYTKYGVPTSPLVPDLSEALSGYQFLVEMMGNYPCYDYFSLMASIVSPNLPAIAPKFEYKLTNKYLIMTFDKPYGLLNPLPSGNDGEIVYSILTNENNNYYLRSTLYYDLAKGEFVYCKSSFRTITFSKKHFLHHFEGSFVYKAQPESDEGYNRFMNVRKEVMEKSDQHSR